MNMNSIHMMTHGDGWCRYTIITNDPYHNRNSYTNPYIAILLYVSSRGGKRCWITPEAVLLARQIDK